MKKDTVFLKNIPAREDMKRSGVYSITNDDRSIFYIGSAKNMRNRLAGQKTDCKRGKGNRVLMKYLENNKWSSLSFNIIEFVEDINYLKERENYWINYYGFSNLTNLAPNAENCKGVKMPQSHRENTSKRLKGVESKVKGYKHSPEKGIKTAMWWENNPEAKQLMIDRNRESQKKIDRASWIKGNIIEVTLNGIIIDECYGKRSVYDKYPLGHQTISKILSGCKKQYKGYTLRYIGKFFHKDGIEKFIYWN